jgi:hypothetical protein
MLSFSGIKLWPIIVGRDTPFLPIDKEFGQRSGFAILLCRRWRDVDETRRLRATIRNRQEGVQPPWPYRPSSDDRSVAIRTRR